MSITIGKRTYDLLNKQITEEFTSEYLYLAMSAVLADMGLNGCASWMVHQANEERQHGIKIYNHILMRGAKVRLGPIPAPKQEWRAPLHIFEEVLRHEQKVTNLIHAIYEAAVADKDYQTMSFIQWFIDEQVDEEATATGLLDRLRKMQSTDLGVLMFDAELGKRTV